MFDVRDNEEQEGAAGVPTMDEQEIRDRDQRP